ncbi:hypothetical protein LCGC14_1454590 [marine sediment metagenome]|uniref:Uncharacterized protein n=1 Tax=marine sediment metagenome TaxID=412755 RepID=A0A0F9LXE8_9ZZZZ
MSNKKYNYRPITVHFDMDDDEDKLIVEWLEKYKTKNNNFSNQIRAAIKAYINKCKNEKMLEM